MLTLLNSLLVMCVRGFESPACPQFRSQGSGNDGMGFVFGIVGSVSSIAEPISPFRNVHVFVLTYLLRADLEDGSPSFTAYSNSIHTEFSWFSIYVDYSLAQPKEAGSFLRGFSRSLLASLFVSRSVNSQIHYLVAQFIENPH